jgi:hypothetical protein
MKNKTLPEVLKNALNSRNSPTDLKPAIIGVVKQVSPVIVTIEDGKIDLEENDELEISEWFRFRCDINKTNALSQTVVDKISSSNNDCSTAESASEKAINIYFSYDNKKNRLYFFRCG